MTRNLILLSMALFIGFSISCARQATNFEAGMRMSNTLYSDLAPQVSTALQSTPENTPRAKHLELASQKLDEYKKTYEDCSKAIDAWKSTGQQPDYLMDLYKEMWKNLLEAQNLAASVYIYASECVANTTLKGKACKN